MRRIVLALLFTCAPAALLSAQTLTPRDIVELTRAGLGDEVLLALIEVHRSVFPIDATTLKALKDAGVRQPVIVAMVTSGRGAPAVPVEEPRITPPEPEPAQVVVVERPVERVREVAVPVAVPVYVPVHFPHFQRLRHIEREPVKRADPVYWGFGGKLRPDAWNPDLPPKKSKRDR